MDSPGYWTCSMCLFFFEGEYPFGLCRENPEELHGTTADSPTCSYIRRKDASPHAN